MNNKFFKQDGLTLVELLGTISVMFIVGSLIFTILINGINYSNTSQSNVSLQQEGNLIITKLTAYHESTRQYEIKVENPSTISLTPYDNNVPPVKLDAKKEIISDSRFEYTLCYKDGTCNGTMPVLTTNKTLSITLTIKNKKEPPQTFKISTVLSRL